MTKIEKQIRAVLDHAMCECPVGPGLFVYLIECPTCLTKRIAAALWQMAQEAYDAGDSGSSEDMDFTGALRALKGEP